MATFIVRLQMLVMAFIKLIGCLLFCFCHSGSATDVPDEVVYTDLHRTVPLGSRAVFKCEFLGTPLAVYWKKGNDPTAAPNLITWFGAQPHIATGSCVADKKCEMGDDFSLIIKNISIADEGRYICRVSNYKGFLIHNFTEVQVIALPQNPWPVIMECWDEQGQNCTLQTTHPVNITCTALRYFPSLDLFFKHDVQNYSTSETLEWTNTDETKSKSIFTTLPPSEKPYICVALYMHGSREQRTAAITITGQSDITATPKADGPIERTEYFVIKIAVPIIAAFCVVTGIILFFTIHRRRQRRRENNYDDEFEAMLMISTRKINGKISYYELWRLIREIDDTTVLRYTLRELGKADIEEDLSEQEAYEILCTWKDNNRSGNEGEILDEALLNVSWMVDYNSAVDKFCAIRKDWSMTIYQHTLEHILRKIGDLQKINTFLNELIPGRPTSVVNDSVDAMQSALNELIEWSNGGFYVNPFVSLSLALERAECRPVAKTFFF